jgi:hypothetical protein
MRELIRQISRILENLPPDAQERRMAREIVRDSDSLLDTVQRAGLKLSSAETKFFKDLPPAIDGAVRGAIHDTLGRSRSGGLSFDLAYRTMGTGYSLTISTGGSTGDVEVILQTPEPARMSTRSASARSKTAGRAARATARKKAPARKRSR